MAAFSFIPIANTNASHERTRLEPGEYKATCTAIQPPAVYRAFSRWYMRVDFAIHDDGELVSKYINLGIGKQPNVQLGPRTEYYKLWAMAVGRRPANNEPLDPARIIGVTFIVTVGDQEHGSDEAIYSIVKSVRRDPEALSSSLNGSSLKNSFLTTQLLNTQVPSSSPENFPEPIGAQVENPSRIATNQRDQSDGILRSDPAQLTPEQKVFAMLNASEQKAIARLGAPEQQVLLRLRARRQQGQKQAA